jgi:hypothetical protein
MAVTACIPTQAKADFLAGVHVSSDVYKCALYTQAAATFDATSTTYSTTGELATANGYTQGGFTMAGYTSATSGTTGYLDWTTDPNWPASSITADAAVIYNSSKSNKIIAILTFTSATSSNGTWTLQLPAPGATAVIRIA